MRLNKLLIPVSALAVVLSGGVSAQAAQRDRHDSDSQQQSQWQGHQRHDSNANNGNTNDNGRRDNATRDRGNQSRDDHREAQRVAPQNNWHGDNRGGNAYHNHAVPVAPNYYRNVHPQTRVYVAPRSFNRYSYPRYYGPGGHFSVFFNIGSGYRFGSPYDGRVYGYIPEAVYGQPVYYGDVRLQIRPREAQVYVDGYYAGIVDDFDGVFQRLTLTVGPHQIEVEAPSLQARIFDVYVDPTHTVDVRADLYPEPR